MAHEKPAPYWAVYTDELGALLALMPDVDPQTISPENLQILLADYRPEPSLWTEKQEKQRRHFASMGKREFATLFTALNLGRKHRAT